MKQDHRITPQHPVVIGGALVIPAGLLAMGGKFEADAGLFGRERRNVVDKVAMLAVMEQERSLGYVPVDVSTAKLGWDIESRIPGAGKPRFIEVKGRVEGATTITVSKNETLAGLNKPDDFILAVV